MPRLFDLITDHHAGEHVSGTVAAELEAAARSDPGCRVRRNVPRALWRAAALLCDRPWLHRTLWTHLGSGRPAFTTLMGPQRLRLFPGFVRARRRVAYAFDGWPCNQPRLLALARDWNLAAMFCSARQAAEQLDAADGRRGRFRWLAEGVDATRYQAKAWAARDIDVLNFGRRWARLHDAVAVRLRADGGTYRCEERRGELLFADDAAFRDGLSRARLSVCVPLTLTDPERAGGIATATNRYLQSMAAGCIPYGHAPAELCDLFGYNPVVEVDWSDPYGQIRSLLADAAGAAALTARNRQSLLSAHTWTQRWPTIAAALHADD